MSTDLLKYAAVMLAAGFGIPILAALNAALGVRIGSPAGAALCLFVVAFLTTFVVLGLTSKPDIAALTSAPRHLFLAGTLVAFYVLSITFVAPHFGVGNAVFFVLLGQMVSAAVIDHMGLFSAQPHPLTLLRGSGIALMALGVFLTQRG